MRKTKKKAIGFALACTMVWGAALVAHASSSATLMSDETTKATACVGNESGCFYWWGNVQAISKYNVEFVMRGGKDSAHCTTVLARHAQAPGSSFGPSRVTASTASYSVGNATMYGNTQNNPKKECIAGVWINRTN